MIFSGVSILVFASFAFWVEQALLKPLRGLALGLPYFFLLGCLVAGIASILWLFLVQFQSDDSTSNRTEILFEKTAYLSLGCVSFLLVMLLLQGVTYLLLKVFHLSKELAYSPMASIIALFSVALLIVYGRFRVLQGPENKKVQITSSKIKGAGLTLVQLSDLHIGNQIGIDYVDGVVEKTNALDPDLIVFTGDIADGDPEAHLATLQRLKKLKSRHGIYYVTGNHEFYWDEASWRAKFSEIGFQVLQNQSRLLEIPNVGQVRIVGVSDLKPDYSLAFRETQDPEAYRIFLAHNPSHEKGGSPFGYDLQLSGHTHGGQFIPWSWIIGLFHTYSRGTYREANRIIHVNEGTGFWGPPLRIGSRCEITEIVIEPSQ